MSASPPIEPTGPGPRAAAMVGLLLLCCASLPACGPAESENASSASAPPTPSAEERRSPAILVRTAPLRRGPIETSIQVTADIETELVVDVYSRVGPAYIADLLVDEGDRLAAGDPLVLLDRTDFEIAVRRRESEVRQAGQRVAQAEVGLKTRIAQEKAIKAGFERAEADLKRALDAMTGGIDVLSRKELADLQKEFEVRQADLEAAAFSREQAETDEELTRLAVEAAQIELDAARRDLEHTVVRAPIDGVVQRRVVNVGLLVSSQTHLFTLVDPDRLVANLRIPQDDLLLVRAGMAVEFHLDALPGRAFSGEVEALNPSVDPGSGLVKVRARLAPDAAGVVLPGMFARARVVVARRGDAMLLSKRAVVYEGGDTWFFSVDEGIAQRHAFVPGASTLDEVEVISVDGAPPAADMRIVTVGQDRLRDGDPVDVVGADVADAAVGGDRA